MVRAFIYLSIYLWIIYPLIYPPTAAAAAPSTCVVII